MSDIFKNEFASVSDKEWRNFLTEASKPLVEAPKEASYQSQMASFAKQLAQSNLDNENAVVEANNMAIDAARQREKEAKAAEKAAKADAKELSKLGLPDISEQKPLPANWHEAKKATGYDQLPYTEQSKIYADWLDQAHVKIVTADRSKAKTAREELEARVPAPTKPKADWYDTDIIDKINEGYNSIASSANKTLASIMPEGSIKQGLYNSAALNDIKVKAARAAMNPETLDAEKTVSLRNQQLKTQYGGEDNIPFVEDFKAGVANMTQGGVVQTIGNIGKSAPAALPSLVGNAMTIGGTMMSATGAGAVVGVPLAVAGRVVSTLGGGAATAADIGGQAWDEAYAFAKSQNKTDAEARALAEEAARQGGLYGAGIGAVEGYLGGKIGAGAIAKAGLKAGAKRIGIEAVTEGVAEGAGAMAVNKILQDQGDQRSLMRGVGSASAQGAIGGAGTTVGMQAVTSAMGSKPAETTQGSVDLTGKKAVQAGVSAASAATNTVAAAAQANVEAAQAAVQAAQATGDETQIAAATAALNAATVQAQAVGEPTDAAGPSKIELIKAAAAAQDAVDAAVAKGDPVEIEAARTEFNNAVSALQADATKNIAAQATSTPAPVDIDLGNPVSEPARLNGIQIRNMLDKVESIAQVRMGNTSQQSDEAKQKAKDLEPLAGAVGRKDSIMAAAKGKQQWALDIKVRGKDPLRAVANDPGLEPAQREAAQAVQEAYKTLGIPLPAHDTTRYPTGNTSGYIESIGDRQKVVLSPSRASPATIIHEYTHGLTIHGLRDMELSNKPDDIAVLEGLYAIIDFIRQHPSVTNTRAGTLYAATNTKELLAEILSGRALPLTSNISVQNIIDQGGLSAGALRGLEILTNHQPTTLAQLFIKARDYILQAMGLARAVEGSVSTAIINAADIAMHRDTRRSSVNEEQLLSGYEHLGKTAEGNFATSLSQLTNGLEQVQDGIYRTSNGTLLDVNDSIAQVSDNTDVQALLEANGFDGFVTEAGEKFALGTVDAEQIGTPQDKALASTIANISYTITDPATTDAQRLTYVAKFLNGTLDANLQAAVNQTGVGLTARAAIETQAPWAQDLMSNDSGLLQTMATSASDIGAGPAEQARAVLRMYAESGQDMPKIIKIRGLIPFDNDTALGVYDPAAHRIELSDLADPGHIVHEYVHGVTQLGIDAASRSKEGKALKAVMQYMLTTMRTTAVRAGEASPYGLKNEHEMMGDLFNPALLRVAAQTPIGTPQSKQAQAMIAELMGEKPGTMIQLLDALIRKIVSFLGVKTVPNNMAELLSRVAARATDETRKAVNDGITPNDAALRPVLSSIDMEVLPASAVPLSAAASKNQLTGRVTSATYINNIANKVNVQPLLKINRAKALAKGENGVRSEIANKLSDAVHDSMGPARRWIAKLPISANAVERLTNLLYLAPGKRDTLLNSVMERHGGDAMIKAMATIKVPGMTHETITQWVGHWITANHVAEKNAMLVAKRAKAHADAAQAAAAAPNNYRLMLAEAEALQAYTDQVKAVSSTNLDAGSEGHPAHAMGVAGGMNNAQAAATMAAVEQHIDTAKLKEVAEHVYDMNAWRLALDIEQGKTSVESVSKFLKLTPEDAATLNDLHDARLLGNVTESMRAAARAIVRSEYVPMTGHPLSAIDATDAGLFSSGAAQPNTGKEYAMEGRTRGIADNGIATTMQGLIRSATFAGYADFTTGVGEVYDMLTPDQRTEVGLVKDNINGLTRGSDNVLLDGRTNNQIGYTIQDSSILDAIRQGNVDAQDGLLAHFVQPVTRGFAYLVTQANPLFGPKNLINDMIERSLIVSTREYHTSAGAKITVGATDVVANTADALAAVNRLIRGKADYSKEADEALRDFIEQGGLSTSREAFARDAKHLVQRIKGAGAGQASPRAIRQMAAGWIEKYNKQFDMVAPLASYLALYRAGVSKTDAAGGALDLMNYRKKGAKTAGFITPMYAFAQPAFTGGANLIGMLRTRKGQMIAVTSFAAFLALQALAEAGADEDEGGNLIRQMPDYARNNNINVQVGDNVVSIPVGFGITKFMNTAARGILDYFNKGTSAFKTGQDILSQGFITSLTPFEDNDIKDPVKNIGYLLAPTVGKPFTAYIMNVRPDGGEIDREKWIDRAKHRHMQGSKKIEPEYRALAANLYDYTGWDMTPDAMKFLVKAYGVGPFKHVVANTITNPYKEAQGKDTGLPGVGSFISPVYKPLNDDAWKGQVRKAQEEMDDMRKEENKLKADTSAEGRVALRELMRKPEYRAMTEFEVKDKALRNESAAVTRSVTSKQITKSAEENRREAIKEKREDAEAQFLVKWRKIKGLE